MNRLARTLVAVLPLLAIAGVGVVLFSPAPAESANPTRLRVPMVVRDQPPAIAYTPTRSAPFLKATPAPNPGGYWVRSSTAHVDPGGFFEIVGEFVNGTAKLVGDVEVNATIYNGAGGAILTAKGFVEVITVPSGAAAPFRVWLKEVPAGAAYYTIAVGDYDVPPALPFKAVDGVHVTVNTIVANEEGQFQVNGILSNLSMNSVKDLMVVMAVYEPEPPGGGYGKVLRVTFQPPVADTLGPGKTTTFSLFVTDGAQFYNNPRQFWVSGVPQ